VTRAAPVPPRWLLWVSFFGAPGLWLVHFMLAYVFTEAICGLLSASAGGVRLTLLLGTGGFVLGTLALTLLAYRVKQRALASQPRYDDFLPRVGFIQGFLFTFVILIEGLPLFFVPMCV
jgi:hypothetical protein